MFATSQQKNYGSFRIQQKTVFQKKMSFEEKQQKDTFGIYSIRSQSREDIFFENKEKAKLLMIT